MEEGGCSSGRWMREEQGEKEEARWPAGVCGLTNSGNSCYMNAVLQSLLSTVPLVEHLLSSHTHNLLANPVVGAFVRLFQVVWQGHTNCTSLREVRAMVSSLHPQFDNQSQQDAQELLLVLLNALHNNLKKKGARLLTRSTQRSRCGRKFAGAPSAPAESSVVTCLFEGQLSYQTLCGHCEEHTHSTQVFTVLSLPLPTDAHKCSLQDCLSLFFQQCTLTCGDQKLCPQCGVKRDTAVLTSLAEAPRVLVLHLQRFGCHGIEKRKLRTNVLFPLEGLDLNPFLSSPSANHTNYSLYAVVNHTGDLNMGHYTALCRNARSGSWYHFDDATVREVEDFLVQSPNAYLLLYSRQPFHVPDIPRPDLPCPKT
uniref:ubiquitinyl hydrolase 1 n=2 Tax=Esox lucius TaxID=8010 RepID=A0A3P8YW10_ESOLU